MTAHNQNGSILLIVTGSIAAVKLPQIIRGLKERHMKVTCVMTPSAQQFITPLTLASLTGKPVYTDLFSPEDEADMSHIQLSRSHDLLAVVPASANCLAKMAQGLCDDLASTLLLATDKPVVVVPAMNVRMWEHPATQRNVAQLKQDGVSFIGPASGELACGETGWGRMVEPDEVVECLLRHCEVKVKQSGAKKSPRSVHDGGTLRHCKAIVTSGPTREAIDPVRYITNRSSGKQGYAIAAALAEAGAEVSLIAGPTNLPDPAGVHVVHVESAQEMYDAVHKALPSDIAVCTAAVADWRTAKVARHKIKKQGEKDNLTFTFAENPDILVSLAKHATKRPALVIGFAAETEHLLENARVKLEKKGCDWIVANDVKNNAVFESDMNNVHVIDQAKDEAWGAISKREVAERLVERIEGFFTNQQNRREHGTG